MTFPNNRSRFNREPNRSWNTDYANYMATMIAQFLKDYERRRRHDYVVAPEPERKILTVDKVEFHALDNAEAHHTDQFELVWDEPPTPVLRRGQYFYMSIRFDQYVNLNEDIIRLIFNFGPRPDVIKNTRADIRVTEDEELDEFEWNARVHDVSNDTVKIQVNIPVTSPVGRWNLIIETRSTKYKVFRTHDCREDIYILFNPWAKADGVYLEDEDQRQEYVLNDTGKVWMGTCQKPIGRRWLYGQFDDVVLPVTIHLLEKSGLPHAERGDPVEMARAITAIMSHSNTKGLIEGRWDGKYTDGTSPLAWTGSVGIMEEYLKNFGMPVKYGQCWVFAGATVTVCRALGIPARPVTNYKSGHDKNSSVNLEMYFTRDNVRIEGDSDGNLFDTIWNYHVWVDAWMARPELPPNFSGWQAIDSTPQELSGNAYRCGPASVEAVRRGEVGFVYDTRFVFSEVNADLYYFLEDEESPRGFSLVTVDKSHIGQKIVTKKVGDDDDDDDDDYENSNNDMEEITNLYKNPEGSHSERESVSNALRNTKRYKVPLPHEEDVKFELNEIDTFLFGESFDVVINMENTSDEPRTIRVSMLVKSVRYNGITAHVLGKLTEKIILDSRESEQMHITITPDRYLDKMADHNLIKIQAIAYVKETKQWWNKEDDFPFLKSHLEISVTGDLTVGGECWATITFTNPIDRYLTECTFSIEAPGVLRPKLIQFRDVRPFETVTYVLKLFPRRPGLMRILAFFNSRNLSGIIGWATARIYAS